MFFCALSGEAPQDPVISQKSGHVYERRLIEKYIQENGTDPMSGEKLEDTDLITVKASPKAAAPRPPTLSSVPALLHSLQNEWDALVLETFQLKQQYNATRQELSYALYAQDAATRVVARLIKERDSAREALGSVQASIGLAPTGNGDIEMATDGAAASAALPTEIIDAIEAKHTELSAVRKKRKAPAGSATTAEVKEYTSTHTIPSLHSSSPPGITSIALSTASPGKFVTGGNDKIVQVYDRGTDKVLGSLKGHSKKITRVALVERVGEPELVLSASADKTARIWALDSASGEYIPKTTIRSHKGEVTGLSVHPLGTLAALGARDGSYSLHDLRGSVSQLYFSPAAESALESLAFHPDGALLGAGTANGTVLMYDVRAGELAAEMAPTQGAYTINALGFSENGYQLLAPASESTVAIWDLRSQKAVHTIDLGAGFGVTSVGYDASAKMLAVGGNGGLRVFAHKTWESVLAIERVGNVADFAWAGLGREIWGATGREVRIWGGAA